MQEKGQRIFDLQEREKRRFYMEQKSKFDKVMGAWDILVIAFGAMIGWGWVINSGAWYTCIPLQERISI